MRSRAASRREGLTNSSVPETKNLAGLESPLRDLTKMLRSPFAASGDRVSSNSTVSAIGSEETFRR